VSSIYSLQRPLGHAVPPPAWSYSGLREWRRCPRRWILRRCGYSNVHTPFYPDRLTDAAVTGLVVHRLIEKYDTSSAQRARSFLPRKEMANALHAIVKSVSGNPRIDTAAVVRRFDGQRCLANFRVFLSHFRRTGLPPPSNVTLNAEAKPRSEFLFRLDKPRITGRIDRVKNGLLTDWKSGAQDDTHVDQARFYALAFWLATGIKLTKLIVFYTRDGQSFESPAPDEAALVEIREALCAEIAQAEIELKQTYGEARPSVENCQFCPVRQLCDEYWQAEETRALRLSPAEADDEILTDVQFDVEAREIGLHTTMFTGTASGGQVRAVIPTTLLAVEPEMIISLRLLNIRASCQASSIVVKPVYGSEVFCDGRN